MEPPASKFDDRRGWILVVAIISRELARGALLARLRTRLGMTAPHASELPRLVVRLIAHRARGVKGKNTIAVARRTLDQLAVVLVPLISQAGFDALLARALQLTQREHPVDQEPGGDPEAAPSETVGLWLEGLHERHTLDAAAALLSALAALLTTLIGESLTTRYLRKAWPDGFNDAADKGTT